MQGHANPTRKNNPQKEVNHVAEQWLSNMKWEARRATISWEAKKLGSHCKEQASPES